MDFIELKNIEEVLAGIKSQHAAAILAQQKQIEDARNEWKGYSEGLIKAGADSQEVKLQLERAIKRLDAMEVQLKSPFATGGGTPVERLGNRFVNHADFKEFAGRGWHQGGKSIKFTDNIWAGTPHDPWEQKTTITSGTVGQATPGILEASRVPGIFGLGRRRIRVRDLLNRVTTTSNAIEWVRITSGRLHASMQTEGISKVETAMTFEIVSTPVRTVAHWIPVTRQVYDDAQFLANAINTELLDGLANEEDAQLLLGDGTGVNLTGLVTASQDYVGTYLVSGDTRLDTLSHAMLEVELGERMVSGIVLNPVDWRAITLIKTNEGTTGNQGGYLMGGPAGMPQATIWGVPVVVTTAMPAGTFLVGDLAMCTVWDRMEATIDVSNQHQDFFTRNMLAIRAEERLALTVPRADYLVNGSF